MQARSMAGCTAALLCAMLAADACPEMRAVAQAGEPAPNHPAAASAARTPTGVPGELQPVVHAQHAKITTCIDTIARESAAVIDARHAAISSWTSTAPNEHLFVSIVGMNYESRIAPHAGAVILAAPVGAGRCEGETVQVVPTARSCSAVQASLVAGGRTIATLQGLLVVQTKSGFRDILLPTAGGGCALVAVGVQE